MEYHWKILLEKSKLGYIILNNGSLVKIDGCDPKTGLLSGSLSYDKNEKSYWTNTTGVYVGYESRFSKKIILQLNPEFDLAFALVDIPSILNIEYFKWNGIL